MLESRYYDRVDRLWVTAFAAKTSDTASTPLQPQLALVDIDRLKEHEDIDPLLLEKLRKEIASDGVLKFAITADKNTGTVLDGHHRIHALKLLGCKRIPVVFIDYNSPDVIVEAWREEEEVTKEDVLKAALSGRKMPPKATKHLVLVNGAFKHISEIEERVDTLLESLR